MITRDSWRGEAAAVVVIISSHYRRHSGVTATTQHLAPAPTAARSGEKYAVTRTFLANHNKPGLSLPCVH